MSDFIFHLSQASWWTLEAKKALEEYKKNPNIHTEIAVLNKIDIAQGDIEAVEKTLVTEGSSKENDK